MLSVKDLARAYGPRVALAGVSFDVAPGEIVGLLGANGAGKSTLMRTAAGLQPPDEGTITLAGHDVWDAPMPARAALGYAAEEPTFHEEISGGEHLAFVAAVRGLPAAEAKARTESLGERLELRERLDDPIRAYSHGMRKKLSFLAAVLHRPKVLLCDEALEGFDAPSAIEAKRELRECAKAGAAVLFSSHVTETVERICDRVVVLREGRVALSLARADWSASTAEHSALERAFLAAIGREVVA